MRRPHEDMGDETRVHLFVDRPPTVIARSPLFHDRGNAMKAFRASRVTSQYQVSIPAQIRKRFGIRAGTQLVWEERDGALVVRPKRSTLEDVRAILRDPPLGRRTLSQLREGKIAAVTAKVRRGRR